MVEIVNTIRFSFPTDAVRPSWDEIGSFVKTLNVSVPDIDTVYKITEDKSVCVKFKCEKAFKDAVQNNGHSHRFHYDDGTSVEVQISDASGNFQYVRVCELPPEVPDHELVLVLEKFGKVRSVIREKVPASLGIDCFSGVRGVHMIVENEIPPALHCLNWKGNIFYQGNKDTCFNCKQKGHRISSCPTKKSRKTQDKGKQDIVQPSSYAEAVNGVKSAVKSSQLLEIISPELSEEESMDMVDLQHKTETKRQLSNGSDGAAGGVLKKTNKNGHALDDHSPVTVISAFSDARGASDKAKPASNRYVDNRGKTFNFNINNYKKQ